MKRTSSCEHHDQKEEARALKRRHDDWQPPAVLKVTLAASAPPSSEAAAVATTISGGTKSNGPTTAGHAASDTEGLARRNQELVCRNQELQQEVEDANRMFQDLSVINCALRTELHEVKQALLNAGTRKDEDLEDVLPVRWFCEASEDEVEQALKEGGRVKYKAQFDKAAKEVDGKSSLSTHHSLPSSINPPTPCTKPHTKQRRCGTRASTRSSGGRAGSSGWTRSIRCCKS